MSLRQKYQTILTKIAPAGAMGLSLALGAAAPAVASEATQTTPAASTAVSERLAAVRAAVTELGQADGNAATDEARQAWYWGNGWPNWRNGWPNWGNWFRNW